MLPRSVLTPVPVRRMVTGRWSSTWEVETKAAPLGTLMKSAPPTKYPQAELETCALMALTAALSVQLDWLRVNVPARADPPAASSSAQAAGMRAHADSSLIAGLFTLVTSMVGSPV